MKKIRLICTKCGRKFEEEVFEPGEAEEKGLKSYPIKSTCPCGGRLEKA